MNNMEKHTYRLEFLFLARLFIIAVVINFFWEMAQMPLFMDMPFDKLASWTFCFRASLGDGFIVISIWAIGRVLFRNARWFKTLKRGSLSVLVISGIIIAVTVEYHAINTGRWGYSSLMPLIPLLDVGLSPFIQLLVLPVISMRLADIPRKE